MMDTLDRITQEQGKMSGKACMPLWSQGNVR